MILFSGLGVGGGVGGNRMGWPITAPVLYALGGWRKKDSLLLFWWRSLSITACLFLITAVATTLPLSPLLLHQHLHQSVRVQHQTHLECFSVVCTRLWGVRVCMHFFGACVWGASVSAVSNCTGKQQYSNIRYTLHVTVWYTLHVAVWYAHISVASVCACISVVNVCRVHKSLWSAPVPANENVAISDTPCMWQWYVNVSVVCVRAYGSEVHVREVLVCVVSTCTS